MPLSSLLCSAVGVMISLWAGIWEILLRFMARQREFFPTGSLTVQRPTQPPIQRKPVALYAGVQLPCHENDHLPGSISEAVS